MDRERRIPPFAEDALDVLNEIVEDRDADADDDDGLPIEDAKALLADDERFTEDDAEYALDALQSRGHVYYANEWVYITPTDD